MYLKIVDNYPEAISEDGLIDVLMGKSYQPPKKPGPARDPLGTTVCACQ